MPKTKSRKSRRKHHELPDESVFDPKMQYDQTVNHLEQLYHEACSVSASKTADVFQLISGFIRMVRNNHKRKIANQGEEYRVAIPQQKAIVKQQYVKQKSPPMEVRSHAPAIHRAPDAPLGANISIKVVNILRDAIARINRPCSRTFERFANSKREITIDSLCFALEELELQITPHEAGSVIGHYDVNHAGLLDLAQFTPLYHEHIVHHTLSNPGNNDVIKHDDDLVIKATTDEEMFLLKQIERILTKDPIPLTQTYHKICGIMGEARVDARCLYEAMAQTYDFECDPTLLEKAISRYDKSTWGLSKSEFVRMLSHAKLA